MTLGELLDMAYHWHQRLVTISITGAMRSAPTKALDAMLNLLPLYQFVQLEAGKAALRLKRTTVFYDGDIKSHLKILKKVLINPLVTVNNDWMETKFNFDRRYNVVEPDRSVWDVGGPQIRSGSIVFYPAFYASHAIKSLTEADYHH